MKIKSNYLEKKGMSICEFRNKIVYELKNRKIYNLKTHVYKYYLKVNDTIINYRNLENKTIIEIVDFYLDDIIEGGKKYEEKEN